MGPASYRYIAADLLTGQFLGELPLYGVGFGTTLNGAGPFSAKLRLPADRMKSTLLLESTETARTVVLVERNGHLVGNGGYILWGRSYDADTQELTLTGAGLWSYYSRRYITGTLKYTGEVRSTVIEGIFARAHAGGGTANPGPLQVRVAAGGGTTDMAYFESDMKLVSEAVEELCVSEAGFDFTCRARREGSEIVRAFQTYPFLSSADTPVFALGGPLTSFTWPEEGSRMTNRMKVLGSGSGPTQAYDTFGAPSGGYPLLEGVVNMSDVPLGSVFFMAGYEYAAVYSRPVLLPDVTISGSVGPEFGTWDIGDYARLVVDPGHPRFPDGLDSTHRILAWETTVSDAGLESIRLVFSEI